MPNHIQIPDSLNVKEFQVLDSSTAYILTKDGGLLNFKPDGSSTLIATPDGLKVTDFHFITEQKGAVVGYKKAEKQSASLFFDTPVFLIGLSIVVGFKAFRSVGSLWKSAFIIMLMTAAVSCGGDWEKHVQKDEKSPYISNITQVPISHSGFHHFGGNAGKENFIAITNDGGLNWELKKIPSNFHVTDINAVGENYVICNYAGKNHPDGDLLFFGSDTTYNNIFAGYNEDGPYGLEGGRGLNGLIVSDSLIISYGSEKILKFPKNENSGTDGNILVWRADFLPPYKIIDVPGEVEVSSLAYISTYDMWALLENKKLMHFTGEWVESKLPGNNTPLKLVAIDERVCALGENGNIFQYTNNEWKAFPMDEKITDIKAGSLRLIALTEANKLRIINLTTHTEGSPL